MYKVLTIKNQFPILNQKINNFDLIYVDNAASTQKPKIVIDKINEVYLNSYANVHRGVHTLSESSTNQLEETRKSVSKFINSKNVNSIIFTKGTTDSLNKIAFGLQNILNSNDEILLTTMEHHANLVCWQQISKLTGVKLKFINFNENFELKEEEIEKLISNKTKIISLTYCSNVLGTINNIEKIIKIAKNKNNKIISIVDAAQLVAHFKIDVKKIDCDFLTFSSHKMYGPTGVGVLYIKEDYFDILQPTEFGGNMIDSVELENFTLANSPFKFEAGTPNIVDIIAFNQTILFLEKIGFENIYSHEKDLIKYFLEKIKLLGDDFILFGPKTINNRCGVFSFKFSNIHSHDLSTLLDQFGIAIRSGHHCAMPLHEKLNTSSTSRISFGIYNTKEEIDIIIETLKKIKKMYKEGNFLI